MTKEQIVALGVRLFSIALVFFLAKYAIPFIPFILRNDELEYNLISVAVVILAFLLLAIYLWFFPLTVARKVLPKEEKNLENKKAFSLSDIETTAFSLLGLWVLAIAISDAVYWLFIWLGLLFARIPMENVQLDSIAATLTAVVELVIGFWLLLGARGLKGLLIKLRYVGSN